MADLGWSDAEVLAAALHAHMPARDPLTLRFPDLERWVAEVPGFAAGPGRPDPRLLEAIQRAWYARFERAPGAPGPAPLEPLAPSR